jgi:hypothetical protein
MTTEQIPLVNPRAHFVDQLHWTDQFRSNDATSLDSTQFRKQYNVLFESRRRSRWTPTFLWGTGACGGAGSGADEEGGVLCWIPKRDGQAIIAELEKAKPAGSAAPIFLPRVEPGKPRTTNQALARSQSHHATPGDDSAPDAPPSNDSAPPAREQLRTGPSGQTLPPYMVERELLR